MAKQINKIHPNDIFEHAKSLQKFSDTCVTALIKQVCIFDLIKLVQLIPDYQKWFHLILKRNPLRHQIEQLVAENWAATGQLPDIFKKYAAPTIWPMREVFWNCPFPSDTKIQMIAATRPDYWVELAKLPPRWKLSHCPQEQIETNFDPAFGKNWRLCAMMRARDPRVLLAQVAKPSDEERDFVTAWTVEQTWRELPDLVVFKIEGFLRGIRSDVFHPDTPAEKYARFKQIKNPTLEDVKCALQSAFWSGNLKYARNILEGRNKWPDEIWRMILRSKLRGMRKTAWSNIEKIEAADLKFAKQAVDEQDINISRLTFEARLFLVENFCSSNFCAQQLTQLWQNLKREQVQTLVEYCIEECEFGFVQGGKGALSFFFQDFVNFARLVRVGTHSVGKIIELFSAFFPMETLVNFAAPFVKRKLTSRFFCQFKDHFNETNCLMFVKICPSLLKQTTQEFQDEFKGHV